MSQLNEELDAKSDVFECAMIYFFSSKPQFPFKNDSSINFAVANGEVGKVEGLY